jgi:hypothetical protein
MDRVLVVGDVHGNALWWVRVCEAALAAGCKQILQLGDFGWWPHVARTRLFLDAVALTLDELDLDCWFIDGNHENFEDLWSHAPDPDGSVHLGPRLRYLPRGHSWVWSGRRFVALGGAYSEDQKRRRPGLSWWPEELIREEDVERAIGVGAADVLVSHDSPLGPQRETPDAVNRAMVGRVVGALRPKLVLCAHYHRRYTRWLGAVRVEGFGRDKQETGNWGVLDLPSLAVS